MVIAEPGVHKCLRLCDLCEELGTVRVYAPVGDVVGADLRAARALDGRRLGDATISPIAPATGTGARCSSLGRCAEVDWAQTRMVPNQEMLACRLGMAAFRDRASVRVRSL